MLSGNIVGCTASNGGGVFVDKAGEFEMSGGSIVGCTAQKENGMPMAEVFLITERPNCPEVRKFGIAE